MKGFIKNVMLLGVCRVVIAADAVLSYVVEQPSQDELKDKREKELKRKMLAAHMLHTLLGVIYND